MTVNGKEAHWREGMTVSELLEQENYRRERVAVECNRAIIRRADFDHAVLNEADEIEVVSFMGGG